MTGFFDLGPDYFNPTPASMADDPYADMECAGCMSGEDCDGWTTETLKCPTTRAFDRQEAAFLDAAREYEEEHGMVGPL